MKRLVDQLRPCVSIAVALSTILAPLGVLPAFSIAPTTLFLDSFGSSNTSTVSGWVESESNPTDARIDHNSETLPSSPTTGHVRLVGDTSITRTISTLGYQNIVLSYFWRGDEDAEGLGQNKDYLRVFWRANGTGPFNQLVEHSLECPAGQHGPNCSWSTQISFPLLPSANNGSIEIRFTSHTTDTNGNNIEEARLDDVLVTGEHVVSPKIQVKKVVINNNGGTKAATDFAFSLTQPGHSTVHASTTGSFVDYSVATTSYSVVEDAAAGYTTTYSSGCNLVTAAQYGQTYQCTITNDDVAPALKVKKHVVGGSLTASQFTMVISTASVSSSQFAGSESGTTVRLNADAQYTVNEAAVVDYDMTTSGSCSGTLGLGQTGTCTLINTYHPHLPPPPVDVCPNIQGDQASVPEGYELNEEGQCVPVSSNQPSGSLTVIKEVIGNTDVFPWNFTMHINTASSSLSEFPGNAEGTVVAIAPGAYTVTETGAPEGFTASMSPDCLGTMTSGASTTCKIQNIFSSDVPPQTTATIIVVKKTVSNEGTFHFNGLGENGFDLTTTTPTETGSRSFEVNANGEGGNQYTVTEDVPSGWTLTSVQCVYDEESVGNQVENGEVVVVHPGDVVTCTFTDTYTAHGSSRHEDPSTGGGGGGGTPTPTPSPSDTPSPTPDIGVGGAIPDGSESTPTPTPSITPTPSPTHTPKAGNGNGTGTNTLGGLGQGGTPTPTPSIEPTPSNDLTAAIGGSSGFAAFFGHIGWPWWLLLLILLILLWFWWRHRREDGK